METATIDETVENIALMISEGRTDDARKALDKAISTAGIDSRTLIKAVSNRSVDMIEEGFNNNRIFLPAMIKSSEFISEMVDKECELSHDASVKTVIIGTVMGDIHEIGKNLCAATLKCKGYKVVDLGCDVPPKDFIKNAIDHNAKLIAVSAPMSTTRAVQKIVVETARSEIGDIYILVGGAACTQKWCDEIKASGYSKNWKEFIEMVDEKIGD